MLPATFSSPRLSLRLISAEDHAFIRELVNTEGWLKFIGDRHIHSEEAAAAYIQKIRNTGDLYYWVVRLRETQTPVGIISFLKRAYLDHFDIGFAFLPAHEGRGYAFEAAETVLAALARLEKFGTILATTLPANHKSIKLLEKLGMQFSKEIQHENETLLVFEKRSLAG